MHIIYLLQFLCGKLAHCLISLRIEMQPVVRILSLQTLRVFRIAGQLIEIDDLVEGTTFSDPFVHGLSHRLVPERIPAVSLGWGDGSAIHLDSLCLGFRYQHLVAGNQGICYMLIISAAATDIVGSLEDDEFIYTCLSQDITVNVSWLVRSIHLAPRSCHRFRDSIRRMASLHSEHPRGNRSSGSDG